MQPKAQLLAYAAAGVLVAIAAVRLLGGGGGADDTRADQAGARRLSSPYYGNPVFLLCCPDVMPKETKTYFLPVRDRGEVTLPAALRRRHQLDRPGAQVEVIEREDGVLEVHPQIPVPADQAWFWTERWQAAEREVDEHVERGEVTVHESADEFLDHVDELEEIE